MKNLILIVFFAFLLFPISSSFSQVTDKPSQFGIALTSFTPYSFKDENGHTVIIGEVENLKNFPITGVKVWGGFYDDIGEQPLETAIGTTILDVIPPFGKSAYMIKSPNPNSAKTNVSVNLLGFTSAPPKSDQLVIDSKVAELGNNIKISGTIKNNAAGEASQTKVHLQFFDAFQPPRILGISTIEISSIGGGATADFEFVEKFDSRTLGYKVFAESANYYSNVKNVEVSQSGGLSKLVTIHDISIKDDDGKKLSGATVGNRITIESKVGIQYSKDQESYEQPIRYYAQVKQSGEVPYVEFLGKYEGRFIGTGPQSVSIDWIPERSGVYFIETFVWDRSNIPIADKGPIILIVVN